MKDAAPELNVSSSEAEEEREENKPEGEQDPDFNQVETPEPRGFCIILLSQHDGTSLLLHGNTSRGFSPRGNGGSTPSLWGLERATAGGDRFQANPSVLPNSHAAVRFPGAFFSASCLPSPDPNGLWGTEGLDFPPFWGS